MCGAILSAARGSGERCKLPQRGLGRSPSGNRIWRILAWKSDIWWHQFSIFPDFSLTFPKKIFPPDLSLTTQILWLFPVPWPVGTPPSPTPPAQRDFRSRLISAIGSSFFLATFWPTSVRAVATDRIVFVWSFFSVSTQLDEILHKHVPRQPLESYCISRS